MNIKQLLIAGCVGMMFAACSSRDDYSTNDGDTIKLRASVVAPTIGTRVGAEETVSIDESLPIGKNILVYFFEAGTLNCLDPDKESWYYEIDNGNNLIPKAIEPTWGNTNLDINAMYPSNKNVPMLVENKAGHYVKEDQSLLTDYEDSDLMIAQLKNQKKVDGPITLPFQHMLSKIVILLESGESGLTVENATDIKIYAKGYYYLKRNADYSISVIEDDYYDPTSISLGDYKANGVACIIPPQTIPSMKPGAEPFITFIINGITYRYDPTPFVLKGGYQYTFTLTINNNTVKARNFTVTPWETEANSAKSGYATY